MQLLLEYPTYHLDDFLWGARWQQVDIQDFIDDQHRFIEADRWIIDGTHFTCIDMRLAQADALCILNLPPTLTLWGFLTRAVRRAFGDKQSLPRAIRDDENYRWSPKWDYLVLKMILGFRYTILPVILDHADKNPSLNILLFKDHKQKYSVLRDLSNIRRGHGEESIAALPD